MNGRVLTCVYCGHEYPQDTPAWGDKVLTDHIAQCEKHPMHLVVQDRNRLRDALIGLVDSDDPDELRRLEAEIRQTDAPQEDKESSINAIQALIASLSDKTGP